MEPTLNFLTQVPESHHTHTTWADKMACSKLGTSFCLKAGPEQTSVVTLVVPTNAPGCNHLPIKDEYMMYKKTKSKRS